MTVRDSAVGFAWRVAFVGLILFVAYAFVCLLTALSKLADLFGRWS